MTETMIKALLPPIRVKTSNGIVDGMLSGRQNRFATVSYQTGKYQWHSFEVSWLTVTNVINNRDYVIA